MKNFERLKELSNEKLLSLVSLAVSRERRSVAQVVAYLMEVQRRQLHFEKAYSSLFTYCEKGLGYSKGSSYRRSSAARFCLEFPETIEKIASGKLCLTVIADLWKKREDAKRRVKEEEKRKKAGMAAAPGSTKNSDCDPSPGGSSTANCGLGPDSSSTAESAGGFFFLQEDAPPISQDETRKFLESLEGKKAKDAQREIEDRFGASSTAEPPRGKEMPISKKITEIRSYLDEEGLKNYDKLLDLLSREIPDRDPSKFLSRLIELGLDKYDPKRREERIQKRKAKSAAAKEFHSEPSQPPILKPFKKRIPLKAKERRTTWLKNNDQGCEFIDKETGRRCGSKRFLEADHVIPVSKGGTNDPENMRYLCRPHNNARNWMEA